MDRTALISELRRIVGDTHVVDRASALLVYEADALPGYRKRPSLAVFPGSRAEVIAVVRLLAARGVPFVPRGAGTGLSGGALADGVVLLGVQRLRRILSIDAGARVATVEPGVVNASLTAAVAPLGVHYAPDPSSQTACTIGGNVAENAGGPHCLKYGVTLNHVVGATIVLPRGDIVSLTVPAHPSHGYDLMGAFVGSEGCFGVLLDATVRLTPNPQTVRTLLADFSSVDDAARTTSAIIASGIVPAACELMDRETIRAVEASVYAAGYPTDAAAVLLVEVDGATDAVVADAARVEALCREGGARDVRVAEAAPERARLWQGRKKAFGAMGRMAPTLAVQDAVVPRTRLAEILAAIAEIAGRHRVRVCNVFHAGDGNLHPNIPYNGRDPDESRRVHDAMREIMSLCINAGGTITGEHGVGLDKLPYMDQLFTADSLDAMCALRDAFDDERRANPGKAVPVRACREWSGTAAAAIALEPPQPGTSLPAPRAAPHASSFATAVERDIAARIVAAQRAGESVYIAGARTRLADAPVDTTLVDARRRCDVIAYVPADLTISVGAGITVAELNAVTAAHDQWCPLFPWGSDASTVGGTLASAARGPANAALGAPRDLTLGLTFVDGRGRIVEAGGRVVKNVAGFDLTRTLIGSWGTLGVITAANLRLRARPAARETWLIPAGAVASGALAAFVRGPCAPLACETVPGAALTAAVGRAAHVDEDYLVVWIGGSAAHIGAARHALRSLGPAHEVSEDIWRAVRAGGPRTPARDAPAMSPELAALTARVRRAFDPHDIFESPAMPREHAPAHA